MTKFVLVFFLSFISLAAYSQKTGCIGCGNGNEDNDNSGASSFFASSSKSETVKIAVFPNPATEFIGISNDDNVSKMVIFNLVGREVRSFEAEKGKTYAVSDLADGMYLVQVYGTNNKLLTTQRLQKR